MTPDNHDSTQGLDVPGILAQLTLEEKASLLDGEDFWRTSRARTARRALPAAVRRPARSAHAAGGR